MGGGGGFGVAFSEVMYEVWNEGGGSDLSGGRFEGV